MTSLRIVELCSSRNTFVSTHSYIDLVNSPITPKTNEFEFPPSTFPSDLSD